MVPRMKMVVVQRETNIMLMEKKNLITLLYSKRLTYDDFNIHVYINNLIKTPNYMVT